MAAVGTGWAIGVARNGKGGLDLPVILYSDAYTWSGMDYGNPGLEFLSGQSAS